MSRLPSRRSIRASSRPRLRATVLASLAAVMTLMGTLAVAASPAAATTHTVAVGLDMLQRPGETAEQAVVRGETQIGHRLAFTRDYRDWESVFPNRYESWLGARGTVPMVSVRPMRANRTIVTEAAIASAQPGSTVYRDILRWARAMIAYKRPVYFTLLHEPETKYNLRYGTSTTYVNAWRKFHHVFVVAGATNVKFLWTMTSYAFEVPSSDRRYAAKWYPGDAYVDAMAADAFNWWNCIATPHWLTLANVMPGFIAFDRSHPGKKLFLAEFGTIEDSRTPGRKAAWIKDTRALLKLPAYAQVAGISYYNAPDAHNSSCGWQLSSSSTALSAMRGLAADPFFQGHA